MSSSSTKDITPASQMAPSQPTGPAPTADKTAAPRAASPGGQEKQPAPSQAAGVAAQPAIVETPAAATTYQAPASAPTSSEKPPLPPSDSTPAPLDTKLDPDADDDIDEDGDPADPVDPALTMTGPAGSFPRVPDEGLRRRRARLMIIHTRLAKFFTWILLLGFVILPGTFNHDAKIKDVPLLALGFVCSIVNALAVFWLWRLRRSNIEWLFTNLFFAGLVNAFSGLVTTFVNIFGVQGGPHGAPTKSTIALTSMFTIVYAILTLIYFRKRQQLRLRRSSRASSATAA